MSKKGQDKTPSSNHNAKQIVLINNETQEIREFPSITSAAK
jgi:hypothetical protein